MNLILPKNYKVFFIISIGLLTAFVTLTLITSIAYAVSSGSVAARPTYSSNNDPRTKSWFIYTYSPGEVRSDSVTVENTGDETVTVKVYPADSTTTSDGAFALENEGEERNGVGTWVKLSTDQVTLAPKEIKDIPFTITVPVNIQKGTFSGGIVFENTEPTMYKTKNQKLNIVQRVGVRIYAEVPGQEQLALEVRDLNYKVINDKLNFSFTVENKGEVHVKPTGRLQVKDLLGRVILTVPLENHFDILLPQDPVTINVPSEILSPIVGWYTADVAIYYSPTKSAVASLTFMPNPIAMYILIFIVVLLVALAVGSKHLVHTSPKTHKTHLAPHIQLIVGGIILGALAFSVLISLLLKTILVY